MARDGSFPPPRLAEHPGATQQHPTGIDPPGLRLALTHLHILIDLPGDASHLFLVETSSARGDMGRSDTAARTPFVHE